jgi:hypothetical protein
MGGKKRKPRAERGKAETQKKPEKPLYVPTALDSLMLAHKHLGSVNLRGGIHGNGTKIEDLIIAANRAGLGVIGIQETQTVGVETRAYVDSKGSTWTLHTGGPSTGKRHRGTGFLVGPDFEVVSFTALSPRVSWIKVQHHPVTYRGPRIGTGVACFVNGYSPTGRSSKKDPVGLKCFYCDLASALKAARTSCNGPNVPVVGDFNVHVGDDLRDLYPDVIGGSLPPGPSTANSESLIAFCADEGLSMVQTYGHTAAANVVDNWATWRHPRLKYPHMRDFILIPSSERTRVRNCRPFDKEKVPTDHKLVLCKVCSGDRDMSILKKKLRFSKSTTGKAASGKRSEVSLNAKVRKLDVSGAKGSDVARNFQNHLRQGLSSQNQDAAWRDMEKAMQQAAVATLPQQGCPQTDTWETDASREDLAPLRKKNIQLRRNIATASSRDFKLAYKSELMINRRAIKKCVKKHKDKYRLQMANIAIRSGNSKQEKFAFSMLAKG